MDKVRKPRCTADAAVIIQGTALDRLACLEHAGPAVMSLLSGTWPNQSQRATGVLVRLSVSTPPRKCGFLEKEEG